MFRRITLRRRASTRVSAPGAQRPLVVGRRVVVLLTVIAAAGLPSVALTSFCAGRACAATSQPASATPFCSLPSPLRAAIVRGFRDGRSPDVVAVTGPITVAGEGSTWNSTAFTDERVPLVFSGHGVQPGASLPSDAGIVDISSTIAEIMGFERDHPDVRAGRVLKGVATGDHPRLVLEVVWHGVDSDLLQHKRASWPALRQLLNAGAGTLGARVGFAPRDDAAVTTTIGSGGYPAQHGMTGDFVRNDQGEAVRSWGPRSPVSVIATLGDHLDDHYHQRAEIGLVGMSRNERGLIGGDWFVDNDRDVIRIGRAGSPGDQASTARRLLKDGAFGRDDVPDLLVVTLSGELASLDAALERLVGAADRATSGSFAIVVTGSGMHDRSDEGVPVGDLVSRVERRMAGRCRFIAAAAASGLFLDQKALAAHEVSDDDVVDVLWDLKTPAGQRLFADVFPGLAVSFSRYCDG